MVQKTKALPHISQKQLPSLHPFHTIYRSAFPTLGPHKHESFADPTYLTYHKGYSPLFLGVCEAKCHLRGNPLMPEQVFQMTR